MLSLALHRRSDAFPRTFPVRFPGQDRRIAGGSCQTNLDDAPLRARPSAPRPTASFWRLRRPATAQPVRGRNASGRRLWGAAAGGQIQRRLRRPATTGAAAGLAGAGLALPWRRAAGRATVENRASPGFRSMRPPEAAARRQRRRVLSRRTPVRGRNCKAPTRHKLVFLRQLRHHAETSPAAARSGRGIGCAQNGSGYIRLILCSFLEEKCALPDLERLGAREKRGDAAVTLPQGSGIAAEHGGDG